MARPRSSTSMAAVRMREYRERRRCGIRAMWLEVDREALEDRVGKFESDDKLRAFVNELIDDIIDSL